MEKGRERPWWRKPNRVLLINLREGDEPRIDAGALIGSGALSRNITSKRSSI
jgi:hypothetical protein